MIWRDAAKHHNHTMNRVKIRLINEHKRRLNWAFQKMKEGADKGVHMEMMEMTEDCMNDNQNLSNELSQKKKVREPFKMLLRNSCGRVCTSNDCQL